MKTEKTPRLAPVIECSRAGDKIVGWIDKRTGKRVEEDGSEIQSAAPKPTKRESDK